MSFVYAEALPRILREEIRQLTIGDMSLFRVKSLIHWTRQCSMGEGNARPDITRICLHNEEWTFNDLRLHGCALLVSCPDQVGLAQYLLVLDNERQSGLFGHYGSAAWASTVPPDAAILTGQLNDRHVAIAIHLMDRLRESSV